MLGFLHDWTDFGLDVYGGIPSRLNSDNVRYNPVIDDIYLTRFYQAEQVDGIFNVTSFTQSLITLEPLVFYVDGISVFFILLTTFLIPVCILVSWYSLVDRVFLFLQLLFILEFILVNCFFVSNLLYFFILFEAVLFPMFFIIGIWGSRDRKIHAVYQFLLYTLVGSIFLYIAIFYI